MDDLDPLSHETLVATVHGGQRISYVREGVGGRPLVLLHGFPETKRIWWRNIGPLADAGFEVIAPDLRGFGDSGPAHDGHYDVAASARDVYALVHDVLGHPSCVAAAGDLGGVVLYDLGLRFEGFVEAQCFFNSVPPALPAEVFAAAGIATSLRAEAGASSDYFVRQGTDADGLAAELDTPERRLAYVADFYGHRLWAGPGGFDATSARFHAEPFADAAALRSSFGAYEAATGSIPSSEPPRFFEPNPVPTLVLYGPEDHVVPRSFPDRCAVAFPQAIGPFVVAGAGHFLQWERAELFNRSLAAFLGP
jgi:pimeloyl-ACP methyl ester carboxylesterase